MNAQTKISDRDQLGRVRSRLRDDDAAHAGADEHGGLRLRREHLADALGVALERDLADGRLVGAAAREVEGLDRVTESLERPDDRLPGPCAGERAVDEDEARHDVGTISRAGAAASPASPWLAPGVWRTALDRQAIAIYRDRT